MEELIAEHVFLWVYDTRHKTITKHLDVDIYDAKYIAERYEFAELDDRPHRAHAVGNPPYFVNCFVGSKELVCWPYKSMMWQSYAYYTVWSKTDCEKSAIQALMDGFDYNLEKTIDYLYEHIEQANIFWGEHMPVLTKEYDNLVD